MPYILKTDAELKRTINNIKAGNATGDGLHNDELQVVLLCRFRPETASYPVT